MTSNLQDEIKQRKPFSGIHEELWLNLLRTAAVVGHTIDQKLRSSGLSQTQYNVMRILRGAGKDGLCQSEIGERLVAQVPDVPRILDRMERAGWIRRERGTSDRRVMLSTLTGQGVEALETLDKPMLEVMAAMFSAMSMEEMGHLNDLLVVARS